MFSWFKKKRQSQQTKPETYGFEIKVGFANDSGSWEESANLVDLLNAVMVEKGYRLQPSEGQLTDPETGFVLTPELLNLTPTDAGVQTCTIITISHPELIPDGLFEYQHATGDDLKSSFRFGFNLWEETDYVVLKSAVVVDKPEGLTEMRMKFPDGRNRRVLLGPVAHRVTDHEAHLAGSECSPDGEQHPFCPCCLFTNNFEAFQPLLEADDVFALRMFAMRTDNGSAEADCRVNGFDHAEGMKSLRKYTRTWPQAGVEFRKQYVLIQSVESGDPVPE